VFLTILTLGVASLFDVKQTRLQLRNVDLFADLKDRKPRQKRILNSSPKLITKLVSNPAVAEFDTLPILDSTGIDYPNLLGDSSSGLSSYFAALNNLKVKGEKVRIAYFGDSSIEGDLITQNLRRMLQNLYGGKGVGFVPITSVTAGFRISIRHKFSENWTTRSLVDLNYKGNNAGITGHAFYPSIDTLKIDTTNFTALQSTVYYGAVNRERLNKFYNIKLFYGPSSDTKNKVHLISKGQVKTVPITGAEPVNELLLNKGIPTSNFALRFESKSMQNIYGVSLESDSGIFVDNFALRGNSGLPLTRIKREVFQSFQAKLKYNLVILHYGLNVLSSTSEDYEWYKSGMLRVIDHIKSSFPGTAILLVGICDKSTKVDGEMVTEPNLDLLLKVQYEVAKRKNIAFWNLYEAMGGYNSMVNWVESDTSLANKDYTHFNYRGSERVARLLQNWLNNNFDTYNKHHVQ
jgi:hypothetical protein